MSIAVVRTPGCVRVVTDTSSTTIWLTTPWLYLAAGFMLGVAVGVLVGIAL